ncbi:ATP-binding cassette domain-containing protein [Phytoactinopolyspora sp. XMNu-373]|uniref:ATP-binding cassette domain-containing protein n=1 Tax=Phytoactinopolyspora mesophila TaxID=2650750 RepID=A0A7K3MAG0_9ACTN|nr:ATP-binding cassette domain-containing protein [Phytoactinopolyspora mesophila]
MHKSFGSIHAVNDVSLHIDAGETYGLLGPNGAGKTTTISILAGLLEADEGSVAVAGSRIRPRSTQGREAIGLVPQDLAIYPDLTGEENLKFFAALYGMSKRDTAARVDEILEVIGLTERRKDRSSKYSGGMKRRLNIGIGLLHSPRLLILDEPTVGVDPQSRNAILESVESLSGEGMAVLYTTHYMEEAERLCDRIGIIDSGRVIAEGTPAELTAGIGEQERVRIEVTGPAQNAADRLGGVEGVTDVAVEDHAVVVLVDSGSARLPSILAELARAGIQIGSIDLARPDLEAVFLHLTGKALRE